MYEKLTIGPIDVIDQFEKFGALDDFPQWVWTDCWKFEVTSDEVNVVNFIYMNDHVPQEFLDVMIRDGFEQDRDDDLDWSTLTKLVDPQSRTVTMLETLAKFVDYCDDFAFQTEEV